MLEINQHEHNSYISKEYSRFQIIKKLIFISFLFSFLLFGSSASALTKTSGEVVIFLREDMKSHKKDYGAGLCLGYISDVYGKMGFSTRYDLVSAINYWNILKNEGKAHYDALANVPIGADVFFNSGSNFGAYGHVGIYIGNGTIIHNRTVYNKDGTVSEYGVVEQYIAENTFYTDCYLGWAWHDWVTITDDTENPIITNAKVSDITPSGYTVTCNVSDNIGVTRVAFPTWTSQNGQDDILWLDGSINNGVASFRVNVSDHNNERECEYITHIYAYDAAGNNTSVGVSAIVPSNKGSVMTGKSEQVIPNGDYIIANAGTQSKATISYLDVVGAKTGWTFDDTNVATCLTSNMDFPDCDTWTVSYDSSKGYYRIKQKGTNMALTVDIPTQDTESANVLVHEFNGADCQYWKISRGSGNGYLVQAYCSGFALDVYGGGDVSGTNVQQYTPHSGDSEAWLFIPYKPSYPIGEGKYILLYSSDQTYELDVLGDTGEIGNNTNVQLWSDSADSQFNSFEFLLLSNGYYKIKHIASGKCLDVTGGISTYGANVAVHDDNGSIAQQWAVVRDGAGYNIISRCNGYALDLDNGDIRDGGNVQVYPRMGNANDHQRWTFVNAEYTISYDLNGGIGTVADQLKNYKTDLVLNTDAPTRDSYMFAGWQAAIGDDIISFSPGDTFTYDQDVTLVATWNARKYTVSYNGNGGSPVPASQTSTGAAITIPSTVPSRDHYRFLGWSASSSATVAEYTPGDQYIAGVSVTLYAVWERSLENFLVLPSMLTEIEEEAFLNTSADAVVIPSSIISIGKNAFGDIAVYGYKGTVAESYAKSYGLTFIPLNDGWVLESDMPAGAHVTDQKWTYTLTNTSTKKSTDSSMDGWILLSTDWEETDTGTWKYASYPSGFDTSNSLYNKYNKSAISSSETATTKRTVDSGSFFVTYIYWHWTFVDSLNSDSDSTNVLVEDAKKYNYPTGNVYRDYIYFDAFEDTVDHGTWGPGSSGQINVDPMRYAWRNNLGDVSHWWWIFEVRQQTYTDYQKVYTYVKDDSEILESSTRVTEADGISNIQHWVKYSF